MDKCHLIISGHKSLAIWAQIRLTKIWQGKNQKLLGFIIYHQSNFDEYLRTLCKKAGNNFKSSDPEVFCKKAVLTNFAKFPGKHLCQSLFFDKESSLKKKRFWYRCFPVSYAKFLRTPFLKEHLRWLPLEVKRFRKKKTFYAQKKENLNKEN